MAGFLALTFVFQSAGASLWAQTIPGLQVTPSLELPQLKGLVLNRKDPFQLAFILGGGKALDKDAGRRLAGYFLASLAVPEKDTWVNLSAFEHERMIPQALGTTPLGQDMLAQDYVLKQLTASLTNPDTTQGRLFWDKVYAEAYKRFGTTDVPVDLVNKVWIVPAKAVVFRKGNSVTVVESKLRVMTETDYLATPAASAAQEVSTGILRDVIIPLIEKDVNTGAQFAQLRQIYNAMILAAWYKKNLRRTILGEAYADQGAVDGVLSPDQAAKERIYQSYLESFKKGAYNFIREEKDAVTGDTVPRKYFSGGLQGVNPSQVVEKTDRAELTPGEVAAQPAAGDQLMTVSLQAGPAREALPTNGGSTSFPAFEDMYGPDKNGVLVLTATNPKDNNAVMTLFIKGDEVQIVINGQKKGGLSFTPARRDFFYISAFDEPNVPRGKGYGQLIVMMLGKVASHYHMSMQNVGTHAVTLIKAYLNVFADEVLGEGGWQKTDPTAIYDKKYVEHVLFRIGRVGGCDLRLSHIKDDWYEVLASTTYERGVPDAVGSKVRINTEGRIVEVQGNKEQVKEMSGWVVSSLWGYYSESKTVLVKGWPKESSLPVDVGFIPRITGSLKAYISEQLASPGSAEDVLSDASQASIIDQLPADLFDYSRQSALLRQKNAPMSPAAYKSWTDSIELPATPRSFTVTAGGQSASFNAGWVHWIEDQDKGDIFSVFLYPSGSREIALRVDYSYRQGTQELLYVYITGVDFTQIELRGVCKAVLHRLLTGIPLGKMYVMNYETKTVSKVFKSENGGDLDTLTSSQFGVTKIGRLLPDDLLNVVPHQVLVTPDGVRLSGWVTFNFSLFAPFTDELAGLFRQARDTEMAYYLIPSQINVSVERQQALREAYPKASVLELKNKFILLLEKARGENVQYKEVLAPALERQIGRLDVLAKRADASQAGLAVHDAFEGDLVVDDQELEVLREHFQEIEGVLTGLFFYTMDSKPKGEALVPWRETVDSVKDDLKFIRDGLEKVSFRLKDEKESTVRKEFNDFLAWADEKIGVLEDFIAIWNEPAADASQSPEVDRFRHQHRLPSKMLVETRQLDAGRISLKGVVYPVGVAIPEAAPAGENVIIASWLPHTWDRGAEVYFAGKRIGVINVATRSFVPDALERHTENGGRFTFTRGEYKRKVFSLGARYSGLMVKLVPYDGSWHKGFIAFVGEDPVARYIAAEDDLFLVPSEGMIASEANTEYGPDKEIVRTSVFGTTLEPFNVWKRRVLEPLEQKESDRIEKLRQISANAATFKAARAGVIFDAVASHFGANKMSDDESREFLLRLLGEHMRHKTSPLTWGALFNWRGDRADAPREQWRVPVLFYDELRDLLPGYHLTRVMAVSHSNMTSADLTEFFFINGVYVGYGVTRFVDDFKDMEMQFQMFEATADRALGRGKVAGLSQAVFKARLELLRQLMPQAEEGSVFVEKHQFQDIKIPSFYLRLGFEPAASSDLEGTPNFGEGLVLRLKAADAAQDDDKKNLAAKLVTGYVGDMARKVVDPGRKTSLNTFTNRNILIDEHLKELIAAGGRDFPVKTFVEIGLGGNSSPTFFEWHQELRRLQGRGAVDLQFVLVGLDNDGSVLADARRKIIRDRTENISLEPRGSFSRLIAVAKKYGHVSMVRALHVFVHYSPLERRFFRRLVESSLAEDGIFVEDNRGGITFIQQKIRGELTPIQIVASRDLFERDIQLKQFPVRLSDAIKALGGLINSEYSASIEEVVPARKFFVSGIKGSVFGQPGLVVLTLQTGTDASMKTIDNRSLTLAAEGTGVRGSFQVARDGQSEVKEVELRPVTGKELVFSDTDKLVVFNRWDGVVRNIQLHADEKLQYSYVVYNGSVKGMGELYAVVNDKKKEIFVRRIEMDAGYWDQGYAALALFLLKERLLKDGYQGYQLKAEFSQVGPLAMYSRRAFERVFGKAVAEKSPEFGPDEATFSLDAAQLPVGGIDLTSLGFSVSESGALDLDWPIFQSGSTPALNQLTPVITGFALVESLPGLL
ncbi:MAG: hypothetical protein WCO69_07170 [Candidatus Omnitrophota bacterium]